MKKLNASRRRALLVAAPVALALSLSACSSDSSGIDTSQEERAANTSSLDALFEGTETAPPTTGPAMTNKSVWWLSCGEAIPECAVPAAAAKEAAEKMGIEFHIADGKLNAGGAAATAVRTALAAGADALIVHGTGCESIQAPLREAKDAGVVAMGVQTLDCDSTDGPKLFTADMNYGEGADTSEDYYTRWGEVAAEYLIAATDGKAKVISNAGSTASQELYSDAFAARLKECSGCEILDTVNFVSADLGPDGTWVQQFRASLAAHPDANSAFLPYDVNIASAGGAQAMAQSGLELIGAGGSGSAAVLDLVRDGKFTAVTGANSATWMGYGAMDNINRALMGEPTVSQGIGFRVVDANHNLPTTPEAAYETPIDFKAAYEKLWSSS